MPDYIILNDLADELGLDRSNLRKYLAQKNITPLKVRDPQKRNQAVSALTLEDAEFVRQERERQGFGKKEVAPIENGDGYFYIIQLIPELAPNRVKLGFATDVANRLQSHRTAAPTAQVIKAWHCKRSWEVAAMASLTRIESILIANEVYECDDLSSLVSRGDTFFSLMP